MPSALQHVVLGSPAVSAQHRKPVVAFVLLACLAVAIVGIRAAEASKGRFIAAAVGVAAEVHGTIPSQSEADRRNAAERVETLGPAFAALNGDAATVTIISNPGAAISPEVGPRRTSLARSTGIAARDSAPRDGATRDGVTRDSAARDGAAGNRSTGDRVHRGGAGGDRARDETPEPRRSAPRELPLPPWDQEASRRGLGHGGEHERSHDRDRGRNAGHDRGEAPGRGHGTGHRPGR